MTKPVNPVPGVGAVVFRNDSVLLVKRGKPPYENQWSIPGGKIRLGETLQQAAEREILEETGIQIRAQEPVYAFDIIETEATGIKYHYIVIDLHAEYVRGEPVPGDDAAQAGWVDRAAIAELDINETTAKLLKEVFDFP